jgi:GxxExxY protein
VEELKPLGAFLAIALVDVLDETHHEGNACTGDSNYRHVLKDFVTHSFAQIPFVRPPHTPKIITRYKHKVKVSRESLGIKAWWRGKTKGIGALGELVYCVPSLSVAISAPMRFLFCGGYCREDRKTISPKETKEDGKKEPMNLNSGLPVSDSFVLFWLWTPEVRTMKDRVFELTDIVRETGYAIHCYHGPGHPEKVYENALVHRLTKQGLRVEQQKPLIVHDEDGPVLGEYIADIVIEGQLILEVKAAKAIADEHVAQTLGYLRSAHLEHGAIANFGAPKFQIRKLAMSETLQQSERDGPAS